MHNNKLDNINRFDQSECSNISHKKAENAVYKGLLNEKVGFLGIKQNALPLVVILKPCYEFYGFQLLPPPLPPPCLLFYQKSTDLQSVSWILAEFCYYWSPQGPYTGTCTILQETINGFLCLLIVFLKSKTHQLNLKDVIKLDGNLR